MQVYVKYNFRKMTYAGKIIDNVNIAKTESSPYSRKAETRNLIFIILTITYTITITYDKGFYHWLFLGFFIIAVLIPWIILKEKSSQNIQKIVTIQLLSIPILDATIVMA